MPTGYIDGLDDLVLRQTGGGSGAPEAIPWFKDARVSGAAAATLVAGKWTSLWQYDGNPQAGAAPGGTVRNPTNTTAGGLLQTDPASTFSKWLTSITAACGNNAMVGLYDRLLDISGFSGTNTGAQTVGGTLARYTNGKCVEAWVEVYTQIGATGTTITAAYTDDNNASKTSPAVAIGGTGFREAQRIIKLPWAAGGTGLKSVQSVTVLATTGTAGDFGVTLAFPLLYFSPALVGYSALHTIFDFACQIQTDACLAWVCNSSVSTIQQFGGEVRFVEA